MYCRQTQFRSLRLEWTAIKEASIEVGKRGQLCSVTGRVGTAGNSELVATAGHALRCCCFGQEQQTQARHAARIPGGHDQKAGIGVWHGGGVAWLGSAVQYGARLTRNRRRSSSGMFGAIACKMSGITQSGFQLIISTEPGQIRERRQGDQRSRPGEYGMIGALLCPGSTSGEPG